ncbi:hypothetical protein V8E36_007353 [Tilletia maclaganii]
MELADLRTRSGSKRRANAHTPAVFPPTKQHIGQILADSGVTAQIVVNEPVPVNEVASVHAKASIDGIKQLEAEPSA